MEIRSVAQFLDYWESFRGRTRRVIECIPPARIEWTHQPGKFTLGDLVRHLATIERYMVVRAMVEHEAHHRGQLYLMLGMLDVATPPLFGLTSEEVRARGARAS